MTPQEKAAADHADRRVMIFHRADGTPDTTMVHVIMPAQTVDFLARFPVDSGEWRAVMADDCTDVDFTKEWGQA
jgi:hypothetical protein